MPILLVDRDDAFRTSLAGMLRDDAHEVTDLAMPGDDRLAEYLVRVSLVIAEYLLPGEHGLSFAGRCQRLRPDLPIVLMSTVVTGSLRAHVEARPAVRALVKPLDYDRLHAYVHELVG